MKLSEVLGKADLTPLEYIGDANISSVEMDSRLVNPGALFICMPGGSVDSLTYIPSAASRGAVAVVVFDHSGVESAIASGIACVHFSNQGIDYSDAIWRICRAFFDSPSRDIKMIGVTGTNGKSTTAWLLRDMLAALEVRAGYIGTLGVQFPGESRELANTTPFAVELYNLIQEAKNLRTEALALEVSSHALEQRRADGLEFDAAIFTNLTQDHLDFHHSMESYSKAKHRLFTDFPNQTGKRFVAVFNVDDPVGARWAIEQNGPTVTYGLHSEADLMAEPIEIKVDRMRLRLEYRGETSVDIPVGGQFNVYNCLSAAAGMIAIGYDLSDIKIALAQVRPVPGRFEAVANNQGIGVLVDYAHTPDALEKLLDSVRQLNPKRIITVFGCGGDRDSTKRPKMGRSASQRSDITIITSDNPRTEDPQHIISEVQLGIEQGKESLSIIDRREAVAHAVEIAEPGDVVVIAGKGHENYQIIGRTKVPMDDRELVREALR